MSKNKHRKDRQAGFSLMELLVVVISLAILSLASVNLFFSTTVGSTRENTIREIKQNGDFLLSQLESDLRSASDITPCQANMTQFSITPVGSTQTNTWAVDGGGRITLNGQRIMSTNVRVKSGTNWDVDCIQDAGSYVKTVNIGFTLTRGNSNSDKEEEFAEVDYETAVTLRNK